MFVNQDDGASQGNSHIMHPQSRALFRFWETARAERPAPGRNEIDLKRIPDLVPNLAILEYDPRGRQFRWRLAGTGVCQLYRRELTGTPALKGLDRFEADSVSRFLANTIHNHQPCVLRFRMRTDMEQIIGAELLGLPMLGSNGLTMQVLAGLFPFRDTAAIAYNGLAQIEIQAARSIWTEQVPDEGSTGPRRPSLMPFQVVQGGRR